MSRCFLFPRFFAVIVLTLWYITGCASNKNSDIQADISQAMKLAGDNSMELKQVLDFYLQSNDTLKYKAAQFLIANMEGHSYVTFYLHDSVKNEIPFNILDYPNYESLLAAFDKLEKEFGPLEFDHKDKIEDLETITADFLKTQIDMAFRAWREKPWAKNLSFENFCEYVLPYRGSNEPLENWREPFWERYQNLEARMTVSTDVIEATRLINDDIRSWFTFDPRYYYHPTDQGLAEMFEQKKGRCEDMTNLTIYAMRANGLAVTSDYTPYWADTGNNHAWNAILNTESIVIPFMGGESNPGEYRLSGKLAKVYRKLYRRVKQNLVFQDRKQEHVPGWLAGKSYLDVTADYVPVSDVTVTLNKDIPDSVDVAYLCVFNSGEWKAIHWGRIKDKQAVFTDMGRDIAYLPALYLNKEIVPCGEPFVLMVDGQMREFPSDTTRLINLELYSAARRRLEIDSVGAGSSFFRPGKQYELFYWADGWKSQGEIVAENQSLIFKEVPSGGFYWLVEEGSDREERLFIYDNGRQVWW
ncbi:MAG: transglutaminase-like domain-containing protein [candidate division Zixibacteria bacterium]|nr:transglutaminase-like domain-containing protein [candidate division Zixibacteria bacterium]